MSAESSIDKTALDNILNTRFVNRKIILQVLQAHSSFSFSSIIIAIYKGVNRECKNNKI